MRRPAYMAAAGVMPQAKAELDAALAVEDALPSAWCLRAVMAAVGL